MPWLLAARLISPVVALILNPPGVDINVPPVVKPTSNDGEGFNPFKQTVSRLKRKPVTAVLVSFTDTVMAVRGVLSQPFVFCVT